MFELRCTVRNCGEALNLNDNKLVCSAGHHFDRPKGGYWNLLQPQDKKSLDPGDTDDAVLARHRWLERGHASSLVETLRPWVQLAAEDSDSLQTLDLGCGEGTLGSSLFSNQAKRYCGIDMSKRAIKLAARRWPQATWILANADRTLPAFDESVDCVVSFFGRRPVTEIYRVLKPSGYCVIAVPGEEDLIELREQTQQAGVRRNRWRPIVDQFEDANIDLVEHILWKQTASLSKQEIHDALAMTYRAVRRSQQQRLETLDRTTVTLAADLILFRKPV